MTVAKPSSVESKASVQLTSNSRTHNQFFLWREFAWGAIAGAFGEGMMHPIDTVKTRIQSQAILSGRQNQKSIVQMIRKVWFTDGLTGRPSFFLSITTAYEKFLEYIWEVFSHTFSFYRGVTPGITGSLATGATYFGVIESTKKWIEESHPSLGGHWAHFIAGAIGDTLGSFVYVPCEVMKQRMQVQGTREYWNSLIMNDIACGKQKPGRQMYDYYSGMFQAGCSIWKEQGPKGLYAGYWSTIARDVPFSGLMVTFYETFKELTDYGQRKWFPKSNHPSNSPLEGLVLGGLAGGLSAYLTTPLDVIKTRLQVQGSTLRYNGWLDAVHRTWTAEGMTGMFRGGITRVIWYVPASALTFMAVEFLRDHFNGRLSNENVQMASLSIEKKGSSLREASR